LLGDFTMTGDVTLKDVADTYGVTIAPSDAHLTLADYFDIHLEQAPRVGAELPLDSIVLVARNIGGNRVNVVGLRLPEDEELPAPPQTRAAVAKRRVARAWSRLQSP
jgi:cell volume regulation protein A